MRRPAPRSMSVLLPDGRSLDMAIRPSDTAESAEITLIEPLHPRFFDECPICGDPATEDEHLPPKRLGGRVMTRTCAPCNNRLGSYVEADLVDWFEDAITIPYFRSGGVRGRRRSGRILIRSTPEGEFVLVIDGSSHPDIAAMLASGDVDLEASRPDRNRYSIALLKQAYLGACLKFGVLEDEGVAQVRRDLLAARDAGGKDDVPPSALALGLTVLRHYQPVELAAPPVVRAVLHKATGPIDGVFLAGRVFVSWSSTLGREAPAPIPRLNRRLNLGAAQQGKVISVNR
ncbi:HNH endonuclease [Micromonospora orduensis]|uniref:HNH endonuclease n=2 Tax=Micromonospora orduensis TaxID=1420891 RepID=A0A5C4QKV0_9ACTN|nr:HNH endonuclease [Micromonospora orduensis]